MSLLRAAARAGTIQLDGRKLERLLLLLCLVCVVAERLWELLVETWTGETAKAKQLSQLLAATGAAVYEIDLSPQGLHVPPIPF